MELQERLNKIENTELSAEKESALLKEIYGYIDLTTLEGTDNEQVINDLCERAMNNDPGIGDLSEVAAVCVYPLFVKQAKLLLKNSKINVASVAGAFPSGQSPLNLRLEEAKYALEKGADEIDMVINRGKLLEGDLNYVFHEVDSFKKLCKQKHLKVILETGELKTEKHIRAASKLAMEAGADFIKTSTGKIKPAATFAAAYVMMQEIKTYHKKTGHKVGIKLAGGISEPEDALKYYMLVQDVLGDEWLNKDYFRIGASRLTGNILSRIRNLTMH